MSQVRCQFWWNTWNLRPKETYILCSIFRVNLNLLLLEVKFDIHGLYQGVIRIQWNTWNQRLKDYLFWYLRQVDLAPSWMESRLWGPKSGSDCKFDGIFYISNPGNPCSEGFISTFSFKIWKQDVCPRPLFTFREEKPFDGEAPFAPGYDPHLSPKQIFPNLKGCFNQNLNVYHFIFKMLCISLIFQPSDRIVRLF